ncbi:putative membrane protein YjcL, partial [Tetrabaena socialis]
VAESNTRWGAALSAPLVSMMCAVALAAGGVIPVDCAVYDSVWTYLMPLAAACFLLETDVGRLVADGGPLLVAFLVGAAGMALGAVAGWWLLRDALGPLGAQLAACLCASYVGGCVNFAAVALAVQLPAAAVPGAMAADNLSMAVFLAILMAVPVGRAAMAVSAAAPGGGMELATAPASPPPPAPAAAAAAAAAVPLPRPVTAESLSLTVAAAAAACASSQYLAAALNMAPLSLLFMAVVAGGIATVGQKMNGRGPAFAGASQMGNFLMGIFFAVIGASAGSLSSLATCGVLVPFMAIMVAVHWAVLVVVGGGLLRLPREALLLGSNANIGGSATAAGMAAAKGWTALVQPAMLVGSLGYVVGTAMGLLVSRVITGA